MHPRPTYDDANLILRLYDMRREARMRQARAWFTSKCKGVQSFDDLMKLAPAGSDENASYRQVVTYWDLVSSFIVSGILHKELFFQSGRELLLVWERVRDLVPSMRETYKDPNYLKNLETVGTEFAAYMKGQSAPAYEAFLKRIK
ncbi:MAG TPA: hypothetical protein VM820_07320 [Vicinamibacterales bacterium]|nr:hypothetical protein [Vicinamibacterales bacterium]